MTTITRLPLHLHVALQIIRQGGSRLERIWSENLDLESVTPGQNLDLEFHRTEF